MTHTKDKTLKYNEMKNSELSHINLQDTRLDRGEGGSDWIFRGGGEERRRGVGNIWG